jgi:hypothetical protein
MAETAALPAHVRRKDSELLKARLGAARWFPGQARHIRDTRHNMAVHTDGVRRRRHWADGVVSATSRCARDAWGKVIGPGWRFGARGSHCAWTSGHWPASACEPSGVAARTPRDAGARSGAPSVPNSFGLACFD